jgi:sortase (surface protein transpeptidase)
MTERPPPPAPESGRLLVGLIVLLLATVGGVMIVIGVHKPGPPPAPADLRTGVVAPAPDPAEGTPIAPPSAHPTVPVRPLSRSVPVELSIPSIKVHTRVSSLGLQPDGTVEVPPLDRDAPVGWYRYLASPGEVGPAVILGHVDSARDGPSVFYRLGQVQRGDTVTVTRADASVATFTVRSVTEVPKSAFPSAEVYGPTQTPELRLVTCGGTFDRSRHSYRDNIIVSATLQSAHG